MSWTQCTCHNHACLAPRWLEVPSELQHVRHNLTPRLTRTGHSPWLLRVSSAISAMVDAAIATRGEMTSRRRIRAPRHWSSSLCHFEHRLHASLAVLPPWGFAMSALGTSSADIVLDQVPASFLPILEGVANGTAPLVESINRIGALEVAMSYYLEYAAILGKEARVHGLSRVRRAEFHFETAGGDLCDDLVHRACVIDLLLDDLESAASHALSYPLMVEVGVNTGEVPLILLSRHPTLHWLGVDPYENQGDQGPGDAAALEEAVSQLDPWLGSRAHLLVARSSQVSDKMLLGLAGNRSVDLVFIDACHSEQSAFEDITFWAPRIRPGGIIAGHDYTPYYGGVVRAVHRALPKDSVLHLAPDGVFWWRV
mmetsp:Transcript_122059/g.356552  ORF Transcript_122059/g.356552 Transcript_122059/m.356552 type:complete len:369 (+) Transcript_122059:40-1146(+)